MGASDVAGTEAITAIVYERNAHDRAPAGVVYPRFLRKQADWVPVITDHRLRVDSYPVELGVRRDRALGGQLEETIQ